MLKRGLFISMSTYALSIINIGYFSHTYALSVNCSRGESANTTQRNKYTIFIQFALITEENFLLLRLILFGDL